MSFQQGLSGLHATAKSLDVIGHNIANASTYGAKWSRAEFADMYAATLFGGGGVNAGIGVTVQAVAQQFTQGNVSPTGNPMDLAINGGGFFQLTDGAGATAYSRNGQFKLDANGFIVNNDGLKLQGFGVDAQGSLLGGSPSALQLPTAGIAPNPSTLVDLELNLDSRWPTTDPGAAATPRINFTDRATYNQSTSVTTFDAQGKPVTVSFYFQKSPTTNEMQVYATADGVTVGGTPANPQPISTLSFNADGTLASSSGNSLPLAGMIPGMGNLALNFGGTTQYGSAYGVTNLRQDGFAAGSMTDILIEADGSITGRYSNGQTRLAGQIQTATFRNPQGLQPVGGNLWRASMAAGTPIPGVPGSGNLGVLQSGALEESNVDLTGELVAMITAQRNYQANAQTIKTQDQVMQTAVNLR